MVNLVTGELSSLDWGFSEALRDRHSTYQFEPVENYSELSEKTFVATVGPSESGKSALTREVMRIAPEFTPNGTRTTRPRKDGDPKNFMTAHEGVTFQSFSNDVTEHRLVNYSIFDTGHAYGTAPEDIGEFAIGPILSDSIDNLWSARFKNFYPVMVLARGAIYQQRLETNRIHDLDIKLRLVEAMGSLAFARRNVEESWLNFVDTGDTPETLEAAARDVVRITYQGTHPIISIPHRLMLISEMETAIQNVAHQLPLK